MPRISLLVVASLLLFAPASGQNPIIHDQFTADPTARVFQGRVYLYPSHDIVAPEGQRQHWFCMADYHVFSSENLTDWTDHGVILSQQDVPWGNPTGYSMWAPDCVEKNGRYYFYFPNAPREGRGFFVGVATADSPMGPFTCLPEPIKGVMGIDPCVLIDHDGQAYLYWSGMGIRGARLKDNMTELDGPLTTMTFPQGGSVETGGQLMEGLPEGFKEGPFVFRRGDWYYLTFPWVRQENGTETLAYAMAKSPLGPWKFQGLIMQEWEDGCWTNHHSIVEYQGQWYLFYHHNDYSPRFDKNRSVCIDPIRFRADGTIVEVKPSLRGVGITPALHRIDIDRYSAINNGATIAYNDTTDAFQGWHATLEKKGAWVRYNGVDFSRVTDGYIVANVRASENTTLYVREKSAKGKIMARIPIVVKSENGPFRRDQSGQWLRLTAPLGYTPQGVTDIVVTCEATGTDIDWLMFKNHDRYFRPATATPARPDAQGFIRRWMLLEPIRQDIRSNVIFTDSWLREAFAKTYFKDQQTMVPRDGQKVKAGQQTLAWHYLDSEHYNVRLFRFAEKWGQQTYGSLFWAVTVIECEEDMTDVRLAVGSNGATGGGLGGGHNGRILTMWNKTLDPQSPDFRFTTPIEVASSDGMEDCDAIDPSLLLDPTTHRLWVTYGTYFGSIRLIELDPATGERVQGNQERDIAIDCEATDLIWRDGWYYLLGTHGTCCDGINSTYNIVVGRSRSVEGPYLDNVGRDMLHGGGRMVIAAGDRKTGPGHFGRTVIDEGVEVMSCHYEADFDQGGRSVLGLRPLLWRNGWPVAGGTLCGPFFTICIKGTDRALTATADHELTTTKLNQSNYQLWRIEQLTDGTYRIMPHMIPGSDMPNTRYCLYSAADSTPTLAEYDYQSDNSKWNLKNP